MRRQRVIATCPVCGNGVPICCHAPCHGIHLLLSLITKGMWTVVWLLLALRSKRCRCSLCGRPLWIMGAQINTQGPTLNSPWIDPRAWRCQRSPRNRFSTHLVENGLVYYAPTRR